MGFAADAGDDFPAQRTAVLKESRVMSSHGLSEGAYYQVDTRQIVLTLVLVGLLMAVAFVAGFGSHWLISQTRPLRNNTDQFHVFWEAWDILENGFLGDIPSEQERTYGAVRGMVETFHDPYTVFVEPQPRELEKDDLRGHFGGIGAWIHQEEDGTIRLSPMKGLPAEKAGIRDGDILVAIDGQLVTPEMSQDQIAALIRGPVGTQVRLTVRRPGASEQLTFQIRRQRIETPSVEWHLLPYTPEIGYLKINLFGERTHDEVRNALADLREQGATSFILDLRHNPGGLLESAVDVTSEFLADGVVLYERRRGNEEKAYQVRGKPLLPTAPLMVLVDEATASAAEIVAGALRDQGRAMLLGRTTFGKGSVQLVHDLSDGSSLHVTVARWLTPGRHQIEGEGLKPDVEVAYEEGRDASLERAVQLLLAQQQHSPWSMKR